MKPAPLYPARLENWWLERLSLRYGDPARAKLFSRIEPHIRQVSDSFTRDRAEQFQKSYQGRENLLAYGLFFFPQTYGRLRLVLEELTRVHTWKPETPEKWRILDLGSGLGAGSFAAADHFAAHPGGLEITAVEQHPPYAESHQRLVHDLPAYGKPLRWNFLTGDLRQTELWAPRPQFRWDLILLNFSFNEAFHGATPADSSAWLQRVIDRLNPGGLLVLVEPALKETSENLETVRDLLLLSEKNHVWAPCLHRQACPALSGRKFWCHEARKWSPPDSVFRLNKNLHREIETLKYSFLVLSRTPPPQRGPDPGHLRLVSPLSKTQGRFHFHGCGAHGAIGHYDLLTRHLDATAKKTWWETERGTVTRLPVQPLGESGSYRILSPTAPVPAPTPNVPS